MTEASDHPLARQCPNCFASPGFPCTQPRSADRVAVGWYHLARKREVSA